MATPNSDVDHAAGVAERPRAGVAAKLAALLAHSSVRLVVVLWVVANVLAVALAGGGLPFHRPSSHGQPFLGQLIFANLGLVEVFLLIWVVYAITRSRRVPDVMARAPERVQARQEVALLLAYGVLALVGGFVLARALGYHPFSFHLVGTIFGTDEAVSPGEALTWAGYNFVAYAVLPYAYFRHRYSTTQLGLTSTNRRNDLAVIVAVLAVETVVQFAAISLAIFDLTPRQLAAGVPITFGLYFLGAVLPTMVFIYCILVPRYLRLTGSVPATVILGGATYTLLHCFDGWLAFDSASAAILSVVFLFFQYFGPGMIKTVLTLRTGNAWVHVWAYHAIAPHVLLDTPLVAKIFGIR